MEVLSKFIWFLESMFRKQEQELDDLRVKIEDLQERVWKLEERM